MNSQRAQSAGPSHLDRLVIAALLAWPLLLWVVVRNRPPWGDEVHFLETVRAFGRGLSIELLRAYPEMTAPLTYIVYSGWGHIAGFSTPALRLLSPLVAWATASIWYVFVLRRCLRSTALALIALATLVLNPYFVGVSVFVFTDMLALLGLALVAAAVQTGRPWLAAIGLAVATSARQYLVFVAPALVAVDWLAEPARAGRGRFTAAAVAGLIPLGFLVLLWDGNLTPDNGIREAYLSEGVRFDPHALSLYLAAPAVYVAPLVALVARRASWPIWMGSALLASFVWFVPVQPSISQTREGVFTVGFLHRALVTALPAGLVDVTFAMLAAVAIASFIVSARRTRDKRMLGDHDRSEVFAWAAGLAFLMVMPFGNIPWEKYALPLFMHTAVILASGFGHQVSAVRSRPYSPD